MFDFHLHHFVLVEGLLVLQLADRLVLHQVDHFLEVDDVHLLVVAFRVNVHFADEPVQVLLVLLAIHLRELRLDDLVELHHVHLLLHFHESVVHDRLFEYLVEMPVENEIEVVVHFLKTLLSQINQIIAKESVN